MGTSLTGTKPKDTYDSLIKVGDNGPISGTAKYLSDGLGNDLPISVSTSAVGIGTSSPTQSLDTAGKLRVRDGGNTTIPSIQLAANGVSGFSNPSATDIAIITNSTEKVRISEAGNVGINDISSGSVASNYAPRVLVGGPIIARSLTTNESLLAIGSDATSAYVSAGKQDGTLTGRDLRFVRGTTEIIRVTAGGLTFNGDTAAANALDSYEEGTFTPTFAGSTTNPTVSYAVQLGRYTKIGRQVTASIEIGTTANTGGVGTIEVAGLPFTVGIRSYMCVSTFNIDNTAATPISIFAEINSGGTRFSLLQTGDNTSWASMNWTQATNATVYVNCTITYFV